MTIRNLIGHLQTETALFKELISILQRETEFIVSRDYKGLSDAVGSKEHLVMRINSMGGTRRALLKEAAAALGLEQDEPSLSSIIELAGKSKYELESCQKTISSLAATIKELNSLNSHIIESSMDNINKTLGFLGNFLQTGAYKPTGSFDAYIVKGARLSEGA